MRVLLDLSSQFYVILRLDSVLNFIAANSTREDCTSVLYDTTSTLRCNMSG